MHIVSLSLAPILHNYSIRYGTIPLRSILLLNLIKLCIRSTINVSRLTHWTRMEQLAAPTDCRKLPAVQLAAAKWPRTTFSHILKIVRKRIICILKAAHFCIQYSSFTCSSKYLILNRKTKTKTKKTLCTKN